jgi:hypothetical protein
MVKAIILLAAAVALTGCAKCFPDRSNVPCNVGFYHAHDWDDVGYREKSPPLVLNPPKY